MLSKLSVYYGRFPFKFCKLSLFLRFARILSKLIDNKMYRIQIKKLNSIFDFQNLSNPIPTWVEH